jgi:hypothetical protein
MHIFQFFILGSILISFYMLAYHIYNKSYSKMNCWRFPMLLAILLESFII